MLLVYVQGVVYLKAMLIDDIVFSDGEWVLRAEVSVILY